MDGTGHCFEHKEAGSGESPESYGGQTPVSQGGSPSGRTWRCSVTAQQSDRSSAALGHTGIITPYLTGYLKAKKSAKFYLMLLTILRNKRRWLLRKCSSVRVHFPPILSKCSEDGTLQSW